MLDADGNLRLDGKDGQISLGRPMLYQDIDRGKKAIAGSFVQVARNEYGFKEAEYDRTKPLIIDPTLNLVYSTYIGGIHEDQAGALALDAQNNVYLTGVTASQDFPVSANAYLNHLVKPFEYELNTFVMKFDSSGTLLFSTFLGGSGANGSLSDQGHPGDEPAARTVAVDAAGNVFVAGTTTSTDFPVTANAYQPTNTGTQIGYLAELSPDGSALEYGSYFGGSAFLLAGSMARAANGQIFVAGSAGPGLPTTSGAYKTSLAPAPSGQTAPYQAAFLSVFDITQTGMHQLLASTYYGTDAPQANSVVTGNLGYTMALDSKGNPWLVGQAYTNNLPTTANAYQSSIPALNTGCGGGGGPLNSVGYIAEFNPSISTLGYASYLSGGTQGQNEGDSCSEHINGLALDSSDNIYVDGATGSASFPVTADALQGANPTTFAYSEFVAKLSTGATSLDWATYLGGSAGSTFSGDLVPDAKGNVWLVGITDGGANFPISSDAYQPALPPGSAYGGFIDEISADGSKLLYGTYFSGNQGTVIGKVALDAAENVYIAGSTLDTSFPVTSNAFQPQFANGDLSPDSSDAFLAILGGGSISAVSPASGGNAGDSTITVTGSGFQQGDTCQLLVNGTVVNSIAAKVSADGTSVSCTFDLSGVAAGTYNVAVINSGGGVAYTKTGAYSVAQGGQPHVWVSVVARPAIRTGVPSLATVNYGNSGDVDAYMVPLDINLSPNLSATYDVGVSPTLAANQSEQTANVGTSGSYIPLILPHLGAGTSGSFPITITDTTDNSQFSLSAKIGGPWYASQKQATSELTAESQAFTATSSCETPDPNLPMVASCLEAYLSRYKNSGATLQQTESLAGAMLAELQQSQQGYTPVISTSIPYNANPSLVSGTLVVTGIPSTSDTLIFHVSGTSQQYLVRLSSNICVFAYGNINDSIGGSAFYTCTIPNVFALTEANVVFAGISAGLTPVFPSVNLIPVPDACFTKVQDITGSGFTVNAIAGHWCTFDDDSPKPDDTGDGTTEIIDMPTASSSASGTAESSIDPNAKYGTTGDKSAKQYINGSAPVPYSTSFENEATASLPAAQVVVTDQLDPSRVDLSTLSLGTITIGANTVSLPAGTSSYSTTYDLSPSLNVLVQGSFDPNSNPLKWTFTSIDPSTGLPPTDPTVGFLPRTRTASRVKGPCSST